MRHGEINKYDIILLYGIYRYIVFMIKNILIRNNISAWFKNNYVISLCLWCHIEPDLMNIAIGFDYVGA